MYKFLPYFIYLSITDCIVIHILYKVLKLWLRLAAIAIENVTLCSSYATIENNEHKTSHKSQKYVAGHETERPKATRVVSA